MNLITLAPTLLFPMCSFSSSSEQTLNTHSWINSIQGRIPNYSLVLNKQSTQMCSHTASNYGGIKIANMFFVKCEKLYTNLKRLLGQLQERLLRLPRDTIIRPFSKAITTGSIVTLHKWHQYTLDIISFHRALAIWFVTVSL